MAIQYGVSSSPWLVAFRSLRAGKNFFMVLVLLALLAQVAGFILVNFVGVLDAAQVNLETPAARAASQPASQPTSQPTTHPVVAAETPTTFTAEQSGQAKFWECLLTWALPVTKFIAFVSGTLAVLLFMFSVKLALIGRLNGIAGFMSAFLWSLLLLAMVTPWQQVLHGAMATGALYNLGELTAVVKQLKPSWGATDVQRLDWALYYARFLAYPALTLLVWLAVMVKFSRGYIACTLNSSTTPTQPAIRPAEPVRPIPLE